MKDAIVKVLSDEDLKSAYALRDLGVNRKVSYLITYLANVGEVSSKEIEKGTGLRQPEVSLAMRTLRDNNWVEERAVKRGEGSGGLTKIYALSTPIDEIIRHYEDEKMRESEQMRAVIQKLKELAPL